MDAIDKHKEERPREGEARPVTYEMFVEMLDLKDSFSSKVIEILVKVSLLPESSWSTMRLTETIRLQTGIRGTQRPPDPCRPPTAHRQQDRAISQHPSA